MKFLRETIEELDSKGNVLSKEQCKFFQYSKIRNTQGKLMVCYHYTDKSFNTFDKSTIGSSTGNKGYFGTGFYFTSMETFGKGYGKNKMEVYLNIENPFCFEDLSANDKDDYLAYVREHMTEEQRQNSPIALRDEEPSVPSYRYDDLTADNFHQGRFIDFAEYTTDFAKSRGYDGIVSEWGNEIREIVAFEPNQIKAITNINPTYKNNINENMQVESIGVESEEQVFDMLDKAFGQKEPYMWSTYILPNGHFLNPDNYANAGELAYEHSDFINFIENAFNISYIDAERFFDEYCIKMNVTYPYLSLPKTKPTAEQFQAIKSVISNKDRFTYEIDDIEDRVGKLNGAKEPLMILTPFDETAFDLSIYSASDIIKEINKAYITKSFLNEKLEPLDPEIEELADADAIVSQDPYDVRNYLISSEALKVLYLPKEDWYVIIDPYLITHWDVMDDLYRQGFSKTEDFESYRWYFIPTSELEQLEDGYLGEYTEEDFKHFVTYAYKTGYMVCLEKDDFKGTSLYNAFGKPMKVDTLYNILHNLEDLTEDVVYRGSGVNGLSIPRYLSKYTGTFFSPSETYASMYGDVSEYDLDDDTKIYKAHKSNSAVSELDLGSFDSKLLKEFTTRYLKENINNEDSSFFEFSEYESYPYFDCLDQWYGLYEDYFGEDYDYDPELESFSEWCNQIVLREYLEKNGYAGIYYAEEDGDEQYQIWGTFLKQIK